MTRIVVLCDGTWNSPDIEDTTHVHALSELLASDSNQKVKYFSGVGVNEPREEGGSFVARGVNKVLGGATGFGLGDKVKEAYKFIAETYQDGDEIYLFGFSRGAYTARSVAGMIRKCGIIDDTSKRGMRKAFRLYRKAGDRNHPDKPHIQSDRANMSPRFATSEKDQQARAGATVPLVNIAYVGVWDTVGARGIPAPLLGIFAQVWNKLYAFHDTDLSSLVRSARHAVAVDERRVFYQPALWGNIARLNAGGSDARYQQKWLVGDHAILGGSAKLDEISGYSLKWVAEGAPALTLRDGATLDQPKADILVDIARFDRPGKIYRLVDDFLKWRAGITSADDLHPSVKERLKQRNDYRPGSAQGILAALGLAD